MSPPHFRVFISSPSDVFAERERVERVITRLNGEFGGAVLEAIRWERAYYTAAKTFQDQIPLPSQTDLVVCILWKRLGFELPPDYRRPDGTTPTGTEYEFEDAMQAARSKGTPDVLVYRKAAPVLLDADQVEVERAQFEALKTFWSRWFRTETGHFTAAYQSFDTTDQFETQVEDHIRQWLARHAVASSGITWPIAQRGSPFRGLQPFDAAHAAVFFGRRRAVERARERLADAAKRGTPFLLVLGTSGSGKSSLARAGLLPRLCQPGAVPGVDVWRSCTVRPSEGDTPLHALARALFRTEAVPELADGDSPAPADLAALLATAPDAAARAVARALKRGTAPMAAREGFDRAVEARLLLLVDQFEEALAPEARDGVARALAALAASGSVWVVATLRSDLYAPFQASAPLVALRDAGAQLDVVAPGPAELAEIVTGPAAAAGLRFDARPDGTGLDEELVAAASQPGALPLLQLALDALFEARDPATNTLTCAAFDALGGLRGVVERRAEAALAALDPDAAAALPAVGRALVNVTEDGVVTGRPAPLHQAAATPAARRLVDSFAAARLLVLESRGGETQVRVAHDALLSGWPRAAALIAADREMLRTRGRVDEAARRWLAEARHPDFLLPPGRPLAEAAELAAERPDSLGPDTAAFIAASEDADAARRAATEAHAQRELRLEAEAQQARADAATKVVRRTRVAIAVVSALLVVAAGAAVFAEGQRREARRQTGVAERQTAVAERQTAVAERNFAAALDAGTVLVDAVNAHLRDGGMTRAAARSLLGTAGVTLGGLVRREEGAALPPPPLQDAQARLQASFAPVQIALCDSKGARARAAAAVSAAEAVAAAAPSDARQRALALALDVLGQAEFADGNLPAALAAFRRAAALVTARPGSAAPWLDGQGAELLGVVRRDEALVLLQGQDWDAALAVLREDLARQHAAGTDVPVVLAAQAIDLRRIAIARFGQDGIADVNAALAEELALLRRLAALQPANLEWQRALAINAEVQAKAFAAQGDMAQALVQARHAVDLATAVAAHDPGNTGWQRDLALANQLLGTYLGRSGDVPGMLQALRATVAAARSLAGPDSTSLACQGDAATLHYIAGTSLLLMGDGGGGQAELTQSLAVYTAMAAATPDDPARLHAVVGAHSRLAQAFMLYDKPGPAAEQYRAGLSALHRLLARPDADPTWQAELADLRLGLGDMLQKGGDLPAAAAVFGEARAAAERQAAAQPDALRWQHDAVVALLRLAGVHGAAERPEEWWSALQAALAGAERLVAREPGNIRWRRDLMDAHQAATTAELVRGHPPEAVAHARAALALTEQWLAESPDDSSARRENGLALRYMGLAYGRNGQPEEARDYAARADAAAAALRAPRRMP